MKRQYSHLIDYVNICVPVCISYLQPKFTKSALNMSLILENANNKNY